MGCGRLDHRVCLSNIGLVEQETIESSILCQGPDALVQLVTEARTVEVTHGVPTKARVIDVNLVVNFGAGNVVSGEGLDDVCVLHGL